ncbi:MAG: hypothetical protein JWN33_330 [Candidatus Saccharibacteria bacterium]|nr:hypothetical protein [Candidatus Saccharibacteria bacterium]
MDNTTDPRNPQNQPTPFTPPSPVSPSEAPAGNGPVFTAPTPTGEPLAVAPETPTVNGQYTSTDVNPSTASPVVAPAPVAEVVDSSSVVGEEPIAPIVATEVEPSSAPSQVQASEATGTPIAAGSFGQSQTEVPAAAPAPASTTAKKKTPVWLWIALVVVVVIGGGVIAYLLTR